MEPYKQLERVFASFNGLDAGNMVVCSSGTAALHLALECLWNGGGLTQFQPFYRGVLIPDFAMIAIPRAVAMAEGFPVVADIGMKGFANEYNLDVPAIIPGSKVTRPIQSIAAVIAVDTYGRPANIRALHEHRAAGRLGDAKIIQDAAEAHGIPIHRDRETNIPLADAICWSFYRNKIIGGQEGGAVWFKDPRAAEAARMRRSMGFTDAHDYQHIPRGHNYRLADALAVLVLNSLTFYRHNFRSRRRLEDCFDNRCPAEWHAKSYRMAPWVYDAQISGEWGRGLMDDLVRALRADNVPVRHGFYPISKQAEFRNASSFWRTDIPGCPNAAERAERTFYLSLNELDWESSNIRAVEVFDVIERLVRERREWARTQGMPGGDAK